MGASNQAIVDVQKSAFRMSIGVKIQIEAAPGRIWALLTDAKDFPRWNSTVTSIEGTIQEGEKIALKVPISDRTFKLKVVELVPEQRMVWADGFYPMFRGERTFTLGAGADGGTDFEMVEVFRGMMLPMIASSLPDFGPAFKTYADDLKREAESEA